MSTFGIILIVYFVVAIAIMSIVIYRRQHDPRPWSDLIEKKPLWKQILPLPIYPIVGIFYVLIQAFDPKERRRRNVKKYLKTEYDLEKEYKELNVDKVDFEDGLEESLHKNASWLLARGLLDKNLSIFLSLVDDNVLQTVYDERNNKKTFEKIKGKSDIEEYWNGWLIQQSENGMTHKYKIIRAKYFQTAALQIGLYDKDKRYCGALLVLFSFDAQEKIHQIIFTGTNIGYTHFLEGKQDLLSTLESLVPDSVMTGFDIGKHLPCPKCGLESSELLWFGYDSLPLCGKVSFCPHCKDIVEHYRNIHYSVAPGYRSPKIGNNEYIENALSSEDCLVELKDPEPMGIHGQVYLETIWDVLKQCNNTIEGTIEDKLLNAANNGVYEAYNNLAVKLLNKDIEKAIDYFTIAANHGVANAMLNLSLWYYAEGENSRFLNYTHQAAMSGHLVGLYNDAVTYHSVVYSGAPLIDKAEVLYKKTIDECYKQIEDENENQKEKDGYCNMVLQYALYNLGLLYFRDYGEYKRHDLGLFYGLKDEFTDLLKAYAYLNECPTQNDKVRNLKAHIYKRILEMQKGVNTDEIKDKQDYDDLPF